MPLQLIHHPARVLAYSTAKDAGGFGHRLGGGGYAGLTPPAGGPPVHLLFRLNTADPAVGLTLPNTSFLPLLVAARYGGCPLGYRVVSDSEVRILSLAEAEPWDDYPTPDYPPTLPEVPIGLAADGYDPDNPAVAWFFSGFFGTAHLTPPQKQKVADLLVESGLFENEKERPDQTPLQAVDEWEGWPFYQGEPADPCPDPACPNHAIPGSLRVFALYQASENFKTTLWGPEAEDVQLVYQHCPACQAILATNQCS